MKIAVESVVVGVFVKEASGENGSLKIPVTELMSKAQRGANGDVARTVPAA